MTTRPRKDTVNDIINSYTEELQAINKRVLDCNCQDDCSMHIFAIRQVEVTRQLMDNLDEYLMQSIDVKLYTSDLGILMNGIEEFAQHKVEEKIYKADVQPRKKYTSTSNKLHKTIGVKDG